MNLSGDEEDPIDRDAIARYLGALFGPVEWQAGQSIALRGLGEKGTLAEGLFREQQWADWSPPDGGAGAIATHAERWRGVNGGAFLIPGVMRPESLENRRQTEADVAWLTSIVVDLDNPDTAEDSLLRLEHALGPAGIIVESSPGKLHAYWLLDEPEDPARVARLRHLLALKAGGDPSFQRIPQVIRIPATDHQKNGGRWRVWMRHCDPDCRHSISGIEDRIQELHALPWASDAAQAMAAQGTLTLSGLEGGTWSAKERLTQDVHAGGQGAATRWDAASSVFGHHVNSFRTGALATIEEAKELARGWMLAHMVPPWPDERFDQEWSAIVRLDVEKRGPLAAPARLYGSGRVVEGQEDQGALIWAVNRWVGREAPPPRKWLVKGLIRAGATHILASAGGVGKTFALLDLCLGIACPQGSPDGWLGQEIDPAHTGGTAVLLTAEDDVDELRIRIHDMDQQGRRFMGADKCLVVPLAQAGGVFPLVEVVQGIARPSAAWQRAMDSLTAIPDLQFVAIDTVSATLHGEENSSVVIQQYMAALNLLRGKVPHIATLGTHHIRKQGTRDAPIQSAADMRQAIRGSNALESSARMVMGIWQPADYAKQLQRLGLPVKANSLFHLAVVKGNNPEAMQGERVLLRAPWGGLMDYTARAVDNTPEGKQNAWLLWCIERAADMGMPFTKTGKTSAYARLASLPPDVADIGGRDALAERVEHLIRAERLAPVSITGKGNGDWLDVPGGALATLTDMDKWHPHQGAFNLDWRAYQYVSTIGQILPI